MFDCFKVNWRRRIFVTNQCARQWKFCDACWPEVLCSKCFRIEAKYLFILKHHQTLLLPDLQEIHTGDCKQQLSESICYIGKTISAMCMGEFVLNIELPQKWLKCWYLHRFAILSFIPMIVISAMILTLLGMMPCRSCHVWTLLKPHQSRYFVYDGMPIISNVLIHCHEKLKNFSVRINFEISTLTWSMIMIDQSLHRVLFLFGYWVKPSRGQILRQAPQTGGSSPNQLSSFRSAWKSDRQHRWHCHL